MAVINLKPFAAAPTSSSGFSIAKGDSKSGEYIRIGITREAQETYFGGPLNPEKDSLQLSIDDDSKSRHLLTLSVADRGDANAMEFSGGIKGSIALKVAPWMQTAPGKRPAEKLAVSHSPKAGAVAVRIPEWARPPVQKPGFGKSIMET
ncbi:hypothetical protein LX70_02644 [Defluviimonas denitrificans]|jgi:hypothetical protein|uniref:Uncharacterized protein n=1 Tax=Albidovulum denitrificans TaxID=404881 RepID=A0A2S8S6K9_9RHOB|nr:hypothetical protein [Defluviimonas denitrificans]PQV56378.1 hypothetical protein LX70_02644 [Defluviimonas denitrificans]